MSPELATSATREVDHGQHRLLRLGLPVLSGVLLLVGLPLFAEGGDTASLPVLTTVIAGLGTAVATWVTYHLRRATPSTMERAGNWVLIAGLAGMLTLFFAALAAIPVLVGALLLGAALALPPRKRHHSRVIGGLLLVAPIGVSLILMTQPASDSRFILLTWAISLPLALATMATALEP